jgi:ribonuclease E
MTLDQAKALLAQAAADAPALHEDEEPDFPEEIDETSDAEAGESEHVEHGGQVDEVPDSGDDHQPMHSDRQNGDGARQNGDGPREGRGRRRRRRGRGGRGGEGREGGPFPPRHDHGSPGAGEPHTIRPPSFAQPEGGEFAPARSAGAWLCPAAPGGGDPHINGDGEPRRRRRGRRGGRRNRRDGTPGNGDFAATRVRNTPAARRLASARIGRRRARHHSPKLASPPTRRQVNLYPDRSRQPSLHRPPPQPAAAEPPRRRSTVREPAPVFSGSTPVVTPMPAPPPPAPTVISTAGADDASKPKKSGWWAKRLLGGD